jgi:SAM-dependent methyltransferase
MSQAAARTAPSVYWLQGFSKVASAVPEVDDRDEVHAWYTSILRPHVPAGASSILDIGCGRGRVLRALMELAPHSRCIGVDGDADSLARAADEFGLLPRQPVLRKADITEPGYALGLTDLDGPFDVITSFFVLHHYKPEVAGAILRELGTLLAPGGVIILAESHDPSLVDASMAEHICAELACLAGEPPDLLWTAEETRAACRAAGFDDSRTSFEAAPGRPFNAAETALNARLLSNLEDAVTRAEAARQATPQLRKLSAVVAKMVEHKVANPARYGPLLALLRVP